jgi:glycosyltransferase involved in cell wall biosynthesis
MTNMRLTIVHPGAELYGADRMLLATIDAVKNHFDVTVVVPCYGALLEEINARHVPVVVAPSLVVLRKELMSLRGMAALGPRCLVSLVRLLILMARLRPSLVYVNTITLPLVLVAARMRGTPTVCHVHEAEVGLHPWVHSLLTAPLCLATKIVAISSASGAFVTARWASLARRVEVIPNGVEVPRSRETLSKTPPIRPVILLPGRLSPRKGTDLAIDAARSLWKAGRPCRLVLAGDTFPGYEWYESELRSKVGEYGLQDNVIFAGFSQQMQALYSAADIVVVPSRVEPFGLVAVEAMLAGRVLIASDIPGLREVVEDGCTGWLVSPTSSALHQAVLERLQDWDVSVIVAERARGVAINRFGLDRYRSCILHLMREVSFTCADRAPDGPPPRLDPETPCGVPHD